ncbi:MAG: hypothetical protein JO291_15945, partial [Acidimicrobiia bacterium]|nr:hypothetical protein [Acidimicrobiia bacterium]
MPTGLHPDLVARSRRDNRRRIAAGLVFAVAFLGVLSAVTPPLAGRLELLDDVLPSQLAQAASATLVFACLGLMLVARSLRRGGRLAWIAVVAVLSLSSLLHLAKGIDVEEATITAAVAIWLGIH